MRRLSPPARGRCWVRGNAIGTTNVLDYVAAMSEVTAHLAPGACVAVIGGGIAGCCVARALNVRGFDITIIDSAPSSGAGASGNPAALFAPRLPRERVPMGRVMASAYLFGLDYYDRLMAEGAAPWLGARGAFVMARDDDEQERQSRALAAFNWPEEVMRWIEPAEASTLTGLDVPRGGLWFARSGTLDPIAVTTHLCAGVRWLQADVASLDCDEAGWLLGAPGGDSLGTFEAVVAAAGMGLPGLLAEQKWPIRGNRGQLTYLPAEPVGPVVPVTYGGYLTPPVALGDGRTGHVLGATYARPAEIDPADWEQVTEASHAHLLGQLAVHFPAQAKARPIGGRTSIRATLHDILPLAGRVDDELYVLGGLGSRGFLTAPLMAEMIAAMMTGATLPLENDLIAAVDPGRFRKRQAAAAPA